MDTIKTLDPTPFKHFCMTIGELPTSFVDSMSYYELLAWLCNYLEKQVVPVVNNNSAVVAELQDFVIHYFDTLDVQEEINNKLDAMAEAGTLQEIITSYLQAKSLLAFDTVADMQAAENVIDGSFVETYGFYAKGDGGGAKYKIRTVTNDDTIDNMFLFSITGDPTDTLVAELVISGNMNVLQFGIQNTGLVDQTAKFQTLIDEGYALYLLDGDYLIEGALEGNITIVGQSQKSIIDGGETKHAVIDCSDPTDDNKVYLCNVAFKNAWLKLYTYDENNQLIYASVADKRNIYAQNVWFDEPVEGDGSTFWGLYIKTPKPEDYTAYGNSGYACYPIEIVNNSGYNALMINNVCTNSEGTAQAASENSAIGVIDKVIGSSPTIFLDIKTGNAARHPLGINSNVGASSAKYPHRVFDLNPAGHIGIGTSCDGDDTAMGGYYTIKMKDEYASIGMKRTDSSNTMTIGVDSLDQFTFGRGSSTIGKVTKQGFAMRYSTVVNDLPNLATDPEFSTHDWEWRGVCRWVQGINKPVFWDGSAWRDAAGTVIKSFA